MSAKGTRKMLITTIIERVRRQLMIVQKKTEMTTSAADVNSDAVAILSADALSAADIIPAADVPPDACLQSVSNNDSSSSSKKLKIEYCLYLLPFHMEISKFCIDVSDLKT
jgi:hypothetical protein